MTVEPAALPLIPFPAYLHAAAPTPLSADSRILTAPETAFEASLLAAALRERTGFPFPVLETNQDGPAAAPGDVVLAVAAAAEESGPEWGEEDYTLVTGETVRITGATPVGVHWGAQTLRQLVSADDEGWHIRGAEIQDAPRFGYRGVMLDVARHFFSVADVCRYIDLANTLKCNVLHLHLSDDQGWRLAINGFPHLTERAAASAALGDAGGWYSQADYAAIVAYAAARHVTVVPEIDVPGHTHAVTVAYPEFTRSTTISATVATESADRQHAVPVHGEPYEGWCVGFSSLKINDEATDAFVAEVFAQVAALTPGPWVHLGGDEAHATGPDEFQSFVHTAAHVVAGLGKAPVAWHEAGRVADLPAGMIGQYWGLRTPEGGTDDAARALVAGGGRLILSPADAVYLDMKYDADSPLGLTWADGPTSIERSYAWDPADLVHGIGEADILGVEAPLWTETVRTMSDVEAMAFPRLASAAEIAWTPRTSPARDWSSFRSRIAGLGPTWQAEGIRFHASEEIPWS